MLCAPSVVNYGSRHQPQQQAPGVGCVRRRIETGQTFVGQRHPAADGSKIGAQMPAGGGHGLMEGRKQRILGFGPENASRGQPGQREGAAPSPTSCGRMAMARDAAQAAPLGAGRWNVAPWNAWSSVPLSRNAI